MAKKRTAEEQKKVDELAHEAAAGRLRKLMAERAVLLGLFPGLREKPIAGDRGPGQPSRRRGMSRAARKAVSIRMTRYWAARRKAKKEANKNKKK